jgi:hypothetical protein
MSLNAEPRQYGAPRIKTTHAANPDSVLEKIMKRQPDASDRTLARALLKKFTPEELEAALCYFVHNRRVAIERYYEEEETPLEVRIQASNERIEERKTAAVKTVAASRRILQSLISLDFIMPNGKSLGKCTFGYATEMGGKFAKIGAMGKPNQIIGTVLS